MKIGKNIGSSIRVYLARWIAILIIHQEFSAFVVISSMVINFLIQVGLVLDISFRAYYPIKASANIPIDSDLRCSLSNSLFHLMKLDIENLQIIFASCMSLLLIVGIFASTKSKIKSWALGTLFGISEAWVGIILGARIIPNFNLAFLGLAIILNILRYATLSFSRLLTTPIHARNILFLDDVIMIIVLKILQLISKTGGLSLFVQIAVVALIVGRSFAVVFFPSTSGPQKLFHANMKNIFLSELTLYFIIIKRFSSLLYLTMNVMLFSVIGLGLAKQIYVNRERIYSKLVPDYYLHEMLALTIPNIKRNFSVKEVLNAEKNFRKILQNGSYNYDFFSHLYNYLEGHEESCALATCNCHKFFSDLHSRIIPVDEMCVSMITIYLNNQSFSKSENILKQIFDKYSQVAIFHAFFSLGAESKSFSYHIVANILDKTLGGEEVVPLPPVIFVFKEIEQFYKTFDNLSKYIRRHFKLKNGVIHEFSKQMINYEEIYSKMNSLRKTHTKVVDKFSEFLKFELQYGHLSVVNSISNFYLGLMSAVDVKQSEELTRRFSLNLKKVKNAAFTKNHSEYLFLKLVSIDNSFEIKKADIKFTVTMGFEKLEGKKVVEVVPRSVLSWHETNLEVSAERIEKRGQIFFIGNGKFIYPITIEPRYFIEADNFSIYYFMMNMRDRDSEYFELDDDLNIISASSDKRAYNLDMFKWPENGILARKLLDAKEVYKNLVINKAYQYPTDLLFKDERKLDYLEKFSHLLSLVKGDFFSVQLSEKFGDTAFVEAKIFLYRLPNGGCAMFLKIQSNFKASERQKTEVEDLNLTELKPFLDVFESFQNVKAGAFKQVVFKEEESFITLEDELRHSKFENLLNNSVISQNDKAEYSTRNIQSADATSDLLHGDSTKKSFYSHMPVEQKQEEIFDDKMKSSLISSSSNYFNIGNDLNLSFEAFSKKMKDSTKHYLVFLPFILSLITIFIYLIMVGGYDGSSRLLNEAQDELSSDISTSKRVISNYQFSRLMTNETYQNIIKGGKIPFYPAYFLGSWSNRTNIWYKKPQQDSLKSMGFDSDLLFGIRSEAQSTLSYVLEEEGGESLKVNFTFLGSSNVLGVAEFVFASIALQDYMNKNMLTDFKGVLDIMNSLNFHFAMTIPGVTIKTISIFFSNLFSSIVNSYLFKTILIISIVVIMAVFNIGFFVFSYKKIVEYNSKFMFLIEIGRHIDFNDFQAKQRMLENGFNSFLSNFNIFSLGYPTRFDKNDMNSKQISILKRGGTSMDQKKFLMTHLLGSISLIIFACCWAAFGFYRVQQILAERTASLDLYHQTFTINIGAFSVMFRTLHQYISYQTNSTINQFRLDYFNQLMDEIFYKNIQISEEYSDLAVLRNMYMNDYCSIIEGAISCKSNSNPPPVHSVISLYEDLKLLIDSAGATRDGIRSESFLTSFKILIDEVELILNYSNNFINYVNLKRSSEENSSMISTLVLISLLALVNLIMLFYIVFWQVLRFVTNIFILVLMWPRHIITSHAKHIF